MVLFTFSSNTGDCIRQSGQGVLFPSTSPREVSSGCPQTVLTFFSSPSPSQLGTSDLGEFHAFIVVDMQDLSKVSGKEIVLLRIRNPWGRRCWKGPWREGWVTCNWRWHVQDGHVRILVWPHQMPVVDYSLEVHSIKKIPNLSIIVTPVCMHTK